MIGLAVLVNQESAIMAGLLAILALIPWLAGQPSLERLRDGGIAALAALVLASPQIAAMAWQASLGGTAAPASTLPAWYRRLGAVGWLAARARPLLGRPPQGGAPQGRTRARVAGSLLLAAAAGVALESGWPGGARADARHMDVGWILVWRSTPDVLQYVAQAGFRFGCRADGVAVYRPDDFRRVAP